MNYCTHNNLSVKVSNGQRAHHIKPFTGTDHRIRLQRIRLDHTTKLVFVGFDGVAGRILASPWLLGQPRSRPTGNVCRMGQRLPGGVSKDPTLQARQPNLLTRPKACRPCGLVASLLPSVLFLRSDPFPIEEAPRTHLGRDLFRRLFRPSSVQACFLLRRV